jgi:hypothetical protein
MTHPLLPAIAMFRILWQAAPQDWLRETNLDLTPEGFILVKVCDSTLPSSDTHSLLLLLFSKHFRVSTIPMCSLVVMSARSWVTLVRKLVCLLSELGGFLHHHPLSL